MQVYHSLIDLTGLIINNRKVFPRLPGAINTYQTLGFFMPDNSYLIGASGTLFYKDPHDLSLLHTLSRQSGFIFSSKE